MVLLNEVKQSVIGFRSFLDNRGVNLRKLAQFCSSCYPFPSPAGHLFPLKGQSWKSLRGRRLSYILKKGQRVDDDLDVANLTIFAFFQFQLDEQIIKALNVTSNGIK